MSPTEGAGRSRWFRLNLWIHRWSSLLATGPFLVLCVTGAILVFHEEIDAALGVIPAATLQGEERLSDCVATVRATFPDQRVLSVGVDPVGHPGVMLAVIGAPSVTGFDDAQFVFLELATARMLGDEPLASSFTGWVLELHAEWFLGPVGRLLGGLVGLLVLASLGSSLVIYAPYMRRIVFGTIRRGRGARLTQLDLHNLVGAAVIGWAVVVSVTGCLLGLGSVLTGLWQMTELSAVRREFADEAPVDVLAPPAPVDRAVAQALAALPPDYHVSSVLFPGTDFTTPIHYGVLATGSEGLDARMIRALLVDARTGEVEREVPLPGYLQAVFLSEPLHFGDYGGLPLKLLWTLCNLLTLFITANGAWLFFDRRGHRLSLRSAEAM